MAKKSLLWLLILFASLVWAAEDGPTTILLVRHAEKSAVPPDNPGLTDAGKARAQILVHMLGPSGFKAIYSSQYARTRETAEPLANHLGLSVKQVDANQTPKLVNELLSQHAGRKVLVVGHSNTLPEIIEALGGGNVPEIEDHEYDNLFVVTVYQPGKAKVLRLKFGNSR